MTEHNILVYKLFLLLNIPDFSLFLSKHCTPPWKKSLPLSQQPPWKTKVLSSLPPVFENFAGGSTLQQNRRRGVHTWSRSSVDPRYAHFFANYIHFWDHVWYLHIGHPNEEIQQRVSIFLKQTCLRNKWRNLLYY